MGPGSAAHHYVLRRVRGTRPDWMPLPSLIQRNALLHHCA